MRPAAIWTIWLTAASMAVAAFGLFLVLVPTLALQGFSLLVYGDPGRLQALGGETARYISLAHAVLGAVMLGWGLMLVAVVQRLLAHGSKLGWQLVAGSLALFLHAGQGRGMTEILQPLWIGQPTQAAIHPLTGQIHTYS